MKKNKAVKRKSKWTKAREMGSAVGYQILEVMSGLVELFPDPLEGHREYIRRLDGWPEEIPRNRLRQELRRMKSRGWIKEAKKNGKQFIKLTKKGRVRALQRQIEALSLPNALLWDGKWRIAIFDIPEHAKDYRNTIRRTLKNAGFHRLQKSVYIYPHELPKELIAYLKESGLMPFIRFARIDQMDDDRDLKQRFDLR